MTFAPGQAMPAVELRGIKGATIKGNRFDGATKNVAADTASSDVQAN